MVLGSLFRRPGLAYIFEAFANVVMSGIIWLSVVIPTCPNSYNLTMHAIQSLHKTDGLKLSGAVD